MPLTRLDLSGSICIEESCTKIIFNDTTGDLVSVCNENQNDSGYGLVGGIDSSDVTSVTLRAYYPSITTPFVFTFTVVSNIITAATLTNLNSVVTDILANLESTAFPLVDFQVNLADYGVTFPSLSDGIVNWDCTISGVSASQSFSYTTSDGQLSDCIVNCCIENKYIALDPSCGCIDDKIKTIIMSEIFLWGARYSMNVGQDDKTDNFIAKANELCNANCEDC